MSTTKSTGPKRFTTPDAETDSVADHVTDRLDEMHMVILDEAEGWEWSVQTLPLDSITTDSELTPEQNAAQQERSRAVARTQLAMCEAPPLIVITRDNVLLEGHPRLSYLQELDETHAVVYRGIPK